MRTVRMSDFGGSGRYNEYKESGRMPQELLEYFKRKARYGMKFQDSGQWSGDISNIRVLQDPEGKNTFYMKGDKGFTPIGSGQDLYNMIGGDNMQSYMGSLGWEPTTDDSGKRTGYTVGKDFRESHLGADLRKFNPYTKASNAFVEEFFGAEKMNDGTTRYSDMNNPLVGEMQRSWFNELDPMLQQDLGGDVRKLNDPDFEEGRRAGQAFRSHDPASQRRIAQRFMVDQLMGGQNPQGSGW